MTGAIASLSVNENYSYDPLERLTNSRVQSGGGTTTSSFQYDVLGDRVSQTVNNTVTNFTYNVTNNELTRSSTTGTNVTYAYNNDGDLVSKSVTSTGKGTVNWSYGWDGSNELLKVTNGTGQALYAYDGGGRMIEAIDSGATPWFFAYKGTDILYKYLLNTDNYEYVSAANIRVVMVIDRTSTYYYHADTLGNVRMLTYSDATYVYLNGYQPFGQDNGTPQGSFKARATEKFQGERWTGSTGLYYDYQRWYDPSIGRFISVDPLAGFTSNPQTLNQYTSLLNSPTNYVDPDGAKPVSRAWFLAMTLFTWVRFASYIEARAWVVDWNIARDGAHTIVTVDNTGPTGNAINYWKYDRPDGKFGFHPGFGNRDTRSMLHPPDIDDPILSGRAMEGFGELAGAEKVLGVWGAALTIINIGSVAHSDYEAGNGYHNTISTIGESAAGWEGALLGGELGATYGAFLGTEAGPPGILVGGIIGGLVGSIIGGIYGTQAFDNLTNPSLNPQSLPSTLPCNVDSFNSWTGLSSPECGSGQEL